MQYVDYELMRRFFEGPTGAQWNPAEIAAVEGHASPANAVTFTEVIPRDPANASIAFKNTALTPNFGIGTRFFMFDWLTVNFALRDYIIPDKFESNPNPPMDRAPFASAADAKANADSALVNNLMLYVGIGVYLPTKFTYKTPQ